MGRLAWDDGFWAALAAASPDADQRQLMDALSDLNVETVHTALLAAGYTPPPSAFDLASSLWWAAARGVRTILELYPDPVGADQWVPPPALSHVRGELMTGVLVIERFLADSDPGYESRRWSATPEGEGRGHWHPGGWAARQIHHLGGFLAKAGLEVACVAATAAASVLVPAAALQILQPFGLPGAVNDVVIAHVAEASHQVWGAATVEVSSWVLL